MKKFLLLLCFVIIAIFGVSAQKTEKTIPDVHQTNKEQKYRRTEIILPQVQGFNCYKADGRRGRNNRNYIRN